MEIANGTPTRSVKISGQIFTVPLPFKVGHTCTVGEASSLNQALTENVRNNNAKAVTTASEDKENPFDQAKAQAGIDAYIKGYEFGQRRSATADPVEKEALDIARELVRNALRKKNVKLSSVTAAQLTEQARKAVADNPQITVHARKRIKERDKLAADILGD